FRLAQGTSHSISTRCFRLPRKSSLRHLTRLQPSLQRVPEQWRFKLTTKYWVSSKTCPGSKAKKPARENTYSDKAADQSLLKNCRHRCLGRFQWVSLTGMKKTSLRQFTWQTTQQGKSMKISRTKCLSNSLIKNNAWTVRGLSVALGLLFCRFGHRIWRFSNKEPTFKLCSQSKLCGEWIFL